ncbi:hypothetical protein RND81_08G074800 [Saponaria officinalis]|uniref:Uncharacterized protein n=1 Tax=Saponaria officinalis TaxID=3572 RepID=A0AAW1J673_SAPOF
MFWVPSMCAPPSQHLFVQLVVGFRCMKRYICKPARIYSTIQVSHMGFPRKTGTTYVDYLVTNEELDITLFAM